MKNIFEELCGVQTELNEEKEESNWERNEGLLLLTIVKKW